MVAASPREFLVLENTDSLPPVAMPLDAPSKGPVVYYRIRQIRLKDPDVASLRVSSKEKFLGTTSTTPRIVASAGTPTFRLRAGQSRGLKCRSLGDGSWGKPISR